MPVYDVTAGGSLHDPALCTCKTTGKPGRCKGDPYRKGGGVPSLPNVPKAPDLLTPGDKKDANAPTAPKAVPKTKTPAMPKTPSAPKGKAPKAVAPSARAEGLAALQNNDLVRELQSATHSNDSRGLTSVEVKHALSGKSSAELKSIAGQLGPTVSKKAKTKQALIDAIAEGTVGFRERGRAIGGGESNRFSKASAAGRVITTAAGSWVIEVPDLPEAWMFEKPDIPAGTPPTITDDGRFYGYFAPANIGHRSYARLGERKVVRSLGRTDYSRFLKRTVIAGGETVLAGPVTMECMHAPTQGYGTLDRRHQAYEDTCSIVARVAVGEDDDGGRWFAGLLEHGVTPEQVNKLSLCHLSLDSQPHPDKPGWQDFVAILAVPTGGWPTAVSADTAQVVHRVVETDEGIVVTASSAPIVFAPYRSPLVDPSVIYALAGGV